MRINTNLAALNAWRTMTTNSTNLQKSLERLASGSRVNRAADDAAGLAVSEKMNAQIRGLNMATRNTQDAISLIQTAEGGAARIQEMMQRMRELAVQAGSDTLKEDDRLKLQKEFENLQKEIDRTTDTVTFNTLKLINGESAKGYFINGTGVSVSSADFAESLTGRTLTITRGAASGSSVAQIITVTNFNPATYKDNVIKIGDVEFDMDTDSPVDGESAKLKWHELTLEQFATEANKLVTNATITHDGTNLVVTSDNPGTAGAVNVLLDGSPHGTVTQAAQNPTPGALTVYDSALGDYLKLDGSDFEVSGDTLTGAVGTAYDGITLALEATADAKVVLGRELTFQVGANAGETIVSGLGNLSIAALQIDRIDIKTQANASDAITALDNALSKVSEERANMGAIQNRLENTVSILGTQIENLTSANSRIRDLDMAQEMANFTKFQILTQASTAMLAQANVITQSVLTLLR